MEDLTVELCAKPSRIDAFVKLLKPHGIIEIARSGVMAMPRSYLADDVQQDSQNKDHDQVDATLLPPG